MASREDVQNMASENGATAAVEQGTPGSGRQAAYQASMEFFLGPLVPLMNDPSVGEIMVNGPAAIYVERGGKIEKTNIVFAGDDELLAAANNIAQFVGRTVSEMEPLLDGRLPDGSRVCIVLSPIAAGGHSVNIRRFSKSAVDPSFLIEKKAITPEALEFLQIIVRGEQNCIVSGGTGSGKTTLLNILSTACGDGERILVIEDTRELQVQKEHVVQLEARPADVNGRGRITVRDLFISALRMRPDRIVVGEVRGGEAVDMIQAMTSGHRGSLCTLHADTPSGACGRLETMCMMADLGVPLMALRRQIADAMDIVIQAARLHNGRRLITHISEIDFDEPNNSYVINDIFNLDTSVDFPELKWTGRRPRIADEIGWRGLTDMVDKTRSVMDAPASA